MYSSHSHIYRNVNFSGAYCAVLYLTVPEKFITLLAQSYEKHDIWSVAWHRTLYITYKL